MLRRRIPVLLALFGLVAAPVRPARAWGFAGHRLVNARAVETLPPPLRSLFEANADYLAEHSIDPDLWRVAGREGEAPNHFLDADAFGASPWDAIPQEQDRHVARHGPEALEQGRVPWRIAEVFEALRAAFADADPSRVLRQAAILGHYVSDAHVPLHAVVNYDGQETGQRGIHSRWESQLVSRFRGALDARLSPPAAAEPATDPTALAFAALKESFEQAEGVLASDREATQGEDREETPEDERYDDAYFERLYSLEGERVAARLEASADRLGSLWLGAWRAAGNPALPDFRFAYVRGRHRGVLLSLDGAGERLIASAIARGAMPQLERLRRDGATAAGVVTTLPPKTAPGHAALYTGAWSPANGISGNWLAVPGESVLRQEDGFSSDRLVAEPIWVSAARQGLSVTVASATQLYPFAPYLEGERFGADFGRRLTLFDSYDRTGALSTVVTRAATTLRALGDWGEVPAAGATEIELKLAGTAFRGLLLDEPEDPVAGYDTLLLALPGAAPVARLKAPPPGDPEAFVPVRLPGPGAAVTYVRLFELSPDGSSLLVYATAPNPMKGNRPEQVAAALEATGGFAGNGASWAYTGGRLGRRIDAGGDGTAEERYLETVALVVRQFSRLNAVCIEETGWDLLVTYLPFPDEFLHAWLGYLEPDAPGHDPALAARIRPYLDRALKLTDDYVGALAEAVGPDVVLAVASDHGQVGVTRRVRPNAILAEAGLLVADAEGTIDASRSRAVYHPGNNGFVLIGGAERGGPVATEDREEVLRAARAALLDARDPETGGALFLDVLVPDGERTPRIGGATGGDLYLVAAPAYDASAYLGDGRFVEAVSARGAHLFGPERPEMHASFTVSGPGVAAGRPLGVIEQVDVAPTLSALLGIDPPRDAEGEVVSRALAWP